MEYNPKVSVITTVFNCEKYIEKTILSVINQSYNNIEYIIIDAGSTDNTINIIKKYLKKISIFISEPDNGMYSGINKGINYSSGEIIAYINSDDEYERDAVKIAVREFELTKASLVFGHCRFIDDFGNILFNYKSVYLKPIFIRWLRRIPFAQQTAFWKKEVYQSIGGFNESLKYCSDTEFFYKIVLNEKYTYSNSNQYLAKFRLHDEALSYIYKERLVSESQIVKKNLKIDKIVFGVFKKLVIETYIKFINLNVYIIRLKNKIICFK